MTVIFNWLNSNAGAVQAGATFVLVAITAYYAWQTKRNVQLLERTEEEAHRPRVAVYITQKEEWLNIIDLVIGNYGNGIARDILFETDDDLELLNKDEKLNDVEILKNGLPTLAPNQIIRIPLLFLIGRLDELQNKNITISLEYKDHSRKHLYKDKITKPIREDIMMRLYEYAEIGNNYIKYGDKILGKDSMSFGEKCGTLMELILLSGDHPLILDQPEDHLDAKFVAEKIVNLIRKQKPNRQIIICSHNANIVVLGDSELVTALSVDSNDIVSTKQGSLENIHMRKTIFNVLEGGAIAFHKREQKYGEITISLTNIDN